MRIRPLGAVVVPCGQTDGPTGEASIRFPEFCERALKSLFVPKSK